MENLHELVGPFGEAVSATLREMAGVESAVRGVRNADESERLTGVCALLHLHPGTDGFLVLSMSDTVATVLAKRVLAEAGTEPVEPMIRDCVGEVANVIAGQAKTLLVGTPRHFTFSTPFVAAEPPPTPVGERCVLEFGSELGEFSLHVRLPS